MARCDCRVRSRYADGECRRHVQIEQMKDANRAQHCDHDRFRSWMEDVVSDECHLDEKKLGTGLRRGGSDMRGLPLHIPGEFQIQVPRLQWRIAHR